MTASPTFLQMATSSYSLPISLIRQYCFCPRIPFFNEVLGVNPGDRLWQRQGVAYHERQRMLNRRRSLKRYGLQEGKMHHDVWLASNTLGCHGICDAIVETDVEVCPVEFKLNAVRPNRGELLQLAAYGIAAEERFGKPCNSMFLLCGQRGKVRHYVLDTNIRDSARKTIDNILKSFEISLLPESPATTAKCSQCEYLNFCGDRETEIR